MQLTEQQKKYAIWGGAIAALYFFGPGIMRSCRQPQRIVVAAPPQRPPTIQQAAPSVNADDPKDASNALVSPGTFAGTWAGSLVVERQGACNLQMEIRQQPDKTFLGFPAMSCVSMQPVIDAESKPMSRQDLAKLMQKMQRPDPATAVLVGAYDKGAINFRVDRITGPNPSGCQWSSAVVTPFGSKQITAQFQDSCGGASFLLQKQR